MSEVMSGCISDVSFTHLEVHTLPVVSMMA